MLEPIKTSEWTPTLAAHLLNRAGFGATPETVYTFSQLKPAEAVERLVRYEPDRAKPPGWTRRAGADARLDREALENLPPKRRNEILRDHASMQSRFLLNLQHWWLERMRSSPNPLEEKLTLFWHGHFATSFEKVDEAYALYLQNQTLRDRAAGNFRDLVIALAQDPAMLIYLDNALSEKAAPNENFARELMELFTLGEGNYTEQDIMEAARAFTGWSLVDGRIAFSDRARMHDGGRKTFMGLTGNLNGYDVIDEVLEHPACPKFIASKIWRFFAYDPLPDALAEELGRVFYDANYEVRPLLEKIFMSREFYSWQAAYAQIKSPVQWLVGTCIALESGLPDEQVCSTAMRTLGQELFVPPNVKGWEGGASWITAATLMQRYNLAGYLVKGASGMAMSGEMDESEEEEKEGMDALKAMADLDEVLPKKHRKTLDAAWKYLEWRIYQRKLEDAEKYAVRQYLTQLPMPSLWSDDDLRNLLHVMMSTPYYQVC